MSVDLVAFSLPILIVAAALAGVLGHKQRRRWRWTAVLLSALLVGVYFAPGWVLWIEARRGDRDAQYQLGNYYWTRFGYMLTDIEARDYWWVEAAKRGHPQAIERVRYFSRFGTSRYILRRRKPEGKS